MKISSSWWRRAGVVAVLSAPIAGALALAQAVNPPAPQAPSADSPREDVVELSPFTVSTTQDRGYTAQSSLGGSRLNTSLKDVASPTSAFTQQFLEDLAVTNLDALAPYMLSTEIDFGEESGSQNATIDNNSRPLRMRGIKGGTISVNFFKSPYRIDTFNTERVDQSRGPNAVLFGIGDPGGIINVSTKRAILSQSKGSIGLTARSHQSDRAEFDYNQPLWRDRMAFRFAASRERSNTWRNYEHDDEDRLFGTLKFRLAPRTELSLEVEQADIDKATKRSYTAYDGYTIWRDAGRAISASPNAALGIARVSTAPWIVYDTAAGTLANWRNLTTSVARTSVSGDNVALTDFSVLPKETSIYGPGFYQHLGYHRLSAYVTHAFTRDFNLEVAAMRTDAHQDNSDPQLTNGQVLRVDTQPTLPAGGPNPNVGRAYFDAQPMRNISDDRSDSLRSILAYKKDLGRWGKHTLAGMYAYDFARKNQRVLREQIISPNAPNPQTAEQNNNRVFRRTYVDLDGPSDKIVMTDYRTQNVSGLRETVSGGVYTTAWLPYNQNTQINSSDGNTVIGMLQSSFWRDRVQTIIGGSQDRLTDFRSTQARTPLEGFRDGVLTPVRSQDGAKLKADSISFSAVVHPTNWLSLTYSESGNSGLPMSNGRMSAPDGTLIRPPTPEGRSRDFGFKLDLWQHRLFVTAQYFETSAERDFDFVGVISGTTGVVWNALDAAGALAANNLVLASVQNVATGATFDSKSHGVEVELTANPSDRWRVFLNYSNGTTTRSNIGREQQAYIAHWRDLWARYGDLPTVDGTNRTVAQAIASVDQSAFSSFVLADQRRPIGQIRHKLNLRTNYTFAAEPLKGFSVGGGARYLGRPIIGFTATGATASEVKRTIYYGSEQVFADANVSYRRKLPAVLGRSVMWSLQLNVNNVFDNDSFVRTRLSRIGELENYRWNPPREWILSSRFAF